ncbi:MAG: hypothetical protein KatS3mg115_0454 [Candidatus Poribacteria bacterium]|nr:MAG: hypothetical protein KatS3mg115_0454 [Candidatus Poribacteria bacterium]
MDRSWKSSRFYLPWVLIALDLVGFGCGWAVAAFLGGNVFPLSWDLWRAGAASCLALLLLLHRWGTYGRFFELRSERVLEAGTKSVFWAFVIMALFAGDGAVESFRSLLAWGGGFLAGTTALVSLRLLFRQVFIERWKRGRGQEKALIVGTEESAQAVQELYTIQRYPRFQFQVVRVPEWPQERVGERLAKELAERLDQDQTIRRVILAPGPLSFREVEELIEVAHQRGTSVALFSERLLAPRGCVADEFLGMPLWSEWKSPLASSPFQRFLKRTMDIVGALVGMPILGLAYLIVGALIKLEDGGPVITDAGCWT